ncbi:MAG: 3-carboxy-cis,cis-muconate cycloisomerase [Acidimicrobiaceae bacterium]|nr:3-carboxy-cis,cis-muconate cycloisomerase [Acidimicrobiaceae bacterium]
MPSEDLFAGATPAMEGATDATAWLVAMLEVEQALAAAVEGLGLLPDGAADAVAAAAEVVAGGIDWRALREEGAVAGTVVVPLVAAVRAAAGEGAAWVHVGATSQDIIDSAMALVARRAAAVLAASLAAVTGSLAALADRHRHTVIAGRTLLQRGEPTTFGLKAAGWLSAVFDAGAGVTAAAAAIPAQLGGAVGTLSSFGEAGPQVVDRFAHRLDLPEPQVPWHTDRAPVVRLASALSLLADAVGKVAGDIILLAQTEVAEVAERADPGRGVSSAMPQKRNPVASVAAVAAVRRAGALGGALAGPSQHQQERAAGAWQAEAPMLSELFGHAAAAVAALADALDGLVVDGGAMARNAGGECTAGPVGASDVLIDRVLARYASSRREGG